MNIPQGPIGLYDPAMEHDACGVGLLVHINGSRSHRIVENGLQVLENMTHRGAESADQKTGDGAGIMMQIPHEFILLQGIALPERGKYGTGLVFFPRQPEALAICMNLVESVVAAEGLQLIAVREVPVRSEILGEIARENEPLVRQIFVTGPDDEVSLERALYGLRKKIEKAWLAMTFAGKEQFYIVSLSCRRLIYKGMLTSEQLRGYFPDLESPNFTSAIALVHSRFSTNTFPTWSLAQPFRLLGHNGEINTIRGNRSWMEARESVLRSDGFSDMESLFPVVQPGMSDSASLDNVLEFMVMSGMSLPHALAMLVPESWNDKNPISEKLKAFYEYHSILMEPWDGPATLLFSDGRYAGGMLDRNGLRPARYAITHSDILVVASETGVLPFEAAEIREKGKLKPGKMLLVDTSRGKLWYDAEIKSRLAEAFPYGEWLEKNRISLDTVSSGRTVKQEVAQYEPFLHLFGYNKEEVERILIPMAIEAKEPVSSMGSDMAVPVLSEQPQLLFNYFRQLFAQVTNPPIDPIREELVMSLTGYIGSIHKNMLEAVPEHCKMVKLKNPVITNQEFDLLCHMQYKGFSTAILPALYNPALGSEGLETALAELCRKAERAVDEGSHHLVLSDRGADAQHAPIPSLLMVSAVHQFLLQRRKRVQIDLVVESGEPREVMHFALLFGFGANAVNPYMAFAVLQDLVKQGELALDYPSAEKHYLKAVHKGLLKVLSKMGISTLRSYRGARLFEAVGLSQQLLDRYFGGILSKIGGLELEDIALEISGAHQRAFGEAEVSHPLRQHPGVYAYRRGGEQHAWNPETIALLQWATRTGDFAKFKAYTRLVDEKSHPLFLRDLLDYKKAPVDLSEVEPVEAITRRFCTGAMSFGSISREAHETLAIAMNALGGRSNTGEGGERAERFLPRPDGSSARSAIKQVASGRFGVTTEYLVNADELQIKIAQGAKPGEGGQLPGYKVDQIIASTRHSIPGISLISPPPHHDIYSIEDLAQLIFDLRNVNPDARISVKLVSESGVGTVAAGVAKAGADLIVISGAEGGTGASPSSSIRYAGLPLEIGLAEVQQTLVLNHLRGQITLQADGQLKTGRDIVIAALMGAEEYGFATSALIVLGCVMMRKCHLNTCPVGVATQNEALRERFKGRAEYLIHFFRFLAEDVRHHLAEMGYRSIDEIVGRTDLLFKVPTQPGSKGEKVSFERMLYIPETDTKQPLRRTKELQRDLSHVLDRSLIDASGPALYLGRKVDLERPVRNVDRSVGAMLSGHVARKFGHKGLPERTIHCTFKGSAGQSFGAFLAKGISFRLEGDANDYLGKGLSGGQVVVVPPQGATFDPADQVIVGNTLLYGATSGRVFINGQAGERFCVRNSGAIAVVEGVGDHGCEYMTGGRAVILGAVGRNFAAGMSGGIAYVYDPTGRFDYFCNMEMVELSLVDDRQDRQELQRLLTEHRDLTGSRKAAALLADWERSVQHFIQVIPIEYKKVLQDEKLEAIRRRIEKVEYDY
ncbi:MAG: glutamate synthase large subunit [Bacteroidales bacterium]